MRLNTRDIICLKLSNLKMDWKKKYQELQNVLTKSKQTLEDVSLKLNYQQKIEQLEEEYQQKIKGFSPAYLSGSSWYVGPSLKQHLQEQLSSPAQLDIGIFSFLCVASRQSEKEK